VTTINSSPELRVYDFGGQAEQYATHTFFLSTRCVFVLVINLHAPDHADINYWLQQITATAAPYKLVIAFTHVDLFVDHVTLEQAWLSLSRTVTRRFAHCIHGHCMVSVVTRAGMQQLAEMIADCASILSASQVQLQCELKLEKLLVRELCDVMLLTCVARAQEARKSESALTLSWAEYARLAATYQITHEHLLHVTRALHCAGSLLWFESCDELRQLVILDPK
jgi:hypothetical protein